MRMRTSLAAAAFSGAAALAALSVPAAHAVDNPAATKAEQFKSAHKAQSKQRPFTATVDGDIQVTKVTVNANSDVVVGLSPKSFNVYVTVTDPSGINQEQNGVDVALWHGSDLESGDFDGFLWNENGAESCEYWSATSATCKFTIAANPGAVDGLWDSSLNGKWNVTVFASANDGDSYENDLYKNHWIKRASSFSGFNASPEPVSKGKTITVSGTLNRASWSYMKYYGYGSQPVQLQFKKAGASTYSTVKTVTTSSSGYAKTTVTASVDGTWRFHYAGNSASSVADAYDYVDVR